MCLVFSLILDLAVSGSYVCNAENKKEKLEILHKM